MRYRINNLNNGITVTQGLIAVNVIIFFYTNLSGADFSKQIENMFCYVSFLPDDWNFPSRLIGDIFHSGEYYRFLTANFLHRDILHLLMNMMALYYLGQVAEYMLGKRNFIIIYLLCAFGTTILSAVVDISMGHLNKMVGASGAVLGIAGCLVGIAIYRKINNIYYGMQINYQPLVMILGLNVVIGLVPGVSFMGHLAGALTGLASGFAYALLIEKKIIK